jgi:hypothetical protein
VTNKTGFGFDDRIYWTIRQLVTPFHKSLSATLLCSTGRSRLLTTLHYSTAPFYSVVLLMCPLMILCTDPTENAVFFCQEYVFICPLPSNGWHSIVERLFHGNVFADLYPSNGPAYHNIIIVPWR